MATYKRASKEITKLVANVMKMWHAPLEDAGVKLSILTVWSPVDDKGVAKGRPIIHGGRAVLAYVKVCSLKQRVQGVGDAELIIDGEAWNGMKAAKKKSLVDHELEHLKIIFDSEDNAKTDSEGRPKMKLKLHDYELGGFNDVALRHGKQSHEAEQVREVFEQHPQMFFGFVDDLREDEERKSKGTKGK